MQVKVQKNITQELANFKVTFFLNHGLRTPNEGITQRYLKNWADVAKYASAVPKNLGNWD